MVESLQVKTLSASDAVGIARVSSSGVDLYYFVVLCCSSCGSVLEDPDVHEVVLRLQTFLSFYGRRD